MPIYPVGVGAKAKLHRADFHIKQLNAQVQDRRYQAGPVAFRVDYENQQLVLFTRPDLIGLKWSVTAGEAIHQSRSALDHIVWDLILANGGTPKEGDSGFPVFWEEGKYETGADRMIDGISEQARAIIGALQPFRADYRADPLYVLNEMWKREKHRLPNIASLAVHALQVSFALPDGIRRIMINLPEGPLPQNAEIERRDLGFHLAPEVPVRGDVAVSRQFVDGPADGRSFPGFLSELHGLSEGIVDSLIDTAS